jgi:hypothetical protein
MPRFYFNVREGQNLHRDPQGQELPDFEAARKEAVNSSREIIAERILHGGSIGSRTIEITDEAGAVVDTVEMREVLIGRNGFRAFADDITQSAPKPEP